MRVLVCQFLERLQFSEYYFCDDVSPLRFNSKGGQMKMFLPSRVCSKKFHLAPKKQSELSLENHVARCSEWCKESAIPSTSRLN